MNNTPSTQVLTETSTRKAGFDDFPVASTVIEIPESFQEKIDVMRSGITNKAIKDVTSISESEQKELESKPLIDRAILRRNKRVETYPDEIENLALLRDIETCVSEPDFIQNLLTKAEFSYNRGKGIEVNFDISEDKRLICVTASKIKKVALIYLGSSSNEITIAISSLTKDSSTLYYIHYEISDPESVVVTIKKNKVPFPPEKAYEML